jgi:hypothetical protein
MRTHSAALQTKTVQEQLVIGLEERDEREVEVGAGGCNSRSAFDQVIDGGRSIYIDEAHSTSVPSTWRAFR